MDFKQPYDRATYLSFLKTRLLPEDFTVSEERIMPSFHPQFIQNVIKIGESPSLDLSVYEAEHPSENDPRVSLSRDTFRLMAQYGKKRALIFLVSKNSGNFRLSLVTIDLKWEEGKRVQKEYSNPRRYSFFLGPETKIHTPEEVLVKRGRIKDFEDLKNRFSIEVVNKEFYTRIAMLFSQLAGGKREIGRKSIDAGNGDLKLPSTNDDTARKEFTVRLIGRLVFCWFLKKKKSGKGLSLLSEILLSSNAVGENKGYYHEILEPLFFGVINTPVSERIKEYKKPPWDLIPFLNGGLFSPHEGPRGDFYELGALNISKHINTLKIPDGWFKKLFDIFETYNFTIDENTSVDVELSIEPEMLGRIFENLLAEINPETGETARKSTGSYYTPRPIVEYMVDESLKQYLLTKTNLSEGKITGLLAYDNLDASLTDVDKDSVIDALNTIKIIDPACGSGAFPMGILQKILLILQKVDPNSQGWFNKKLAAIGDSSLRKDLKSKLKADNFNYIHKLGIIRDAIYGVDIQPVAVEISKLRFFLSLIVDEKVNDAIENRGIEPLPNLEFKFVCANSLIGLPKIVTKIKKVLTDKQETMFESNEDIDVLKSLRDDYLRSWGDEKSRIVKRFQETQTRMFKHSLNWGGNDSQTLKLSQWNPFSNESCSWFDPDWMFGVKGGFDVVIGNPPYGVTMSGNYRDLVLKSFNTVPDYEIYYFFIELAYKLLNECGVKSFIIPNTILFNVFAAKYRLRLMDLWEISEIIDCTNFVVFEAATIRNIITIFRKKNGSTHVGYRNTENITSFEQLIRKPRLIAKKEMIVSNNQNWGLVFKLPQEIMDLVKIIRNDKKALKYYFPEISQGLIAYDKYQGQSKKTITSRKYHFTSKVKNGLKPWLWGEDVKRYQIVWNGQEYIDYCDEIANPREPKYFIGPRLLVREITNPSIFAGYTDKEMYNDPAVINVLPGKGFPLGALLAILNSRLATFYHFNSSPKATKGAFPKILVEDIKNFPLPVANEKTQVLLTKLNKLSRTLIGNPDDINNDKEIDQLVYDLYSLTKDKITIVEQLGKK